MSIRREEEQVRVRTAKTDFNDSCGEQVRKGEKFIIVEPRPQFYSHRWLTKALGALEAESSEEEKEGN